MQTGTAPPIGFVLVLMSVVVLVPLNGRSAQPLSSDDVVRRVQETRQRYRTFHCQIHKELFRLVDGKQQSRPDEVTDIETRETPSGSWVRMQEKPLGRPNDGGRLARTATTYSVLTGAKYGKRLDEHADRSASGVIDAEITDTSEMRVSDALWSIFGHSWDYFLNPATFLGHEQKDGKHFLTAKLHGRADYAITVAIDPDKGFLPFMYEVRGQDGIVVDQCLCSDFRPVGAGLWVPFRYERTSRGGPGYLLTYDVQTAEVNVPIPVDDLELRFPRGTVVSDHRYHMDRFWGLYLTAAIGAIWVLWRVARRKLRMRDNPEQAAAPA